VSDQELRINTVFVVKDEWPLLALSITHSLLNYAEKVFIIDTGSTDGTFKGIREMQGMFPERIELLRCPMAVFDQTPLANIGLFLSQEEGAKWTLVLDGDEFFYTPSYESLHLKLGATPSNYLGFAIPVVNYAPFAEIDDARITSYLQITARINSINAYNLPDEKFVDGVIKREIMLQQKQTPDKVLIRSDAESFISQGNHQFVFGDGKHWAKWDSRVASSTELKWRIFHLPYTTHRRLERRLSRKFFDKEKTTWRLSTFEGQYSLSSKELFERAIVGKEEQLAGGESTKYANDDLMSLTLASSVEFLKNDWERLCSLSFVEEDREFFSSHVEIEFVSRLVRKFYDKSFQLWNKSSEEHK
jgi:hypothetical protein